MSSRALLPAAAAALLLVATAGCHCSECYLALDATVVTEPSGGRVAVHDPGGGSSSAVEPYRVRRGRDRLHATGDGRIAELSADAGGGHTAGRIVVERRPTLTADGLQQIDTLLLTRCESHDGGAWWFDGVFVRARPAAAGRAQLVVHVGRPATVRVGDRELLGPGATWQGGAAWLAPGVAHELSGSGWEARCTLAAGTCLQLVEDPRLPAGTLQRSLGDATLREELVRAGGETEWTVTAGGARLASLRLRTTGERPALRFRLSRREAAVRARRSEIDAGRKGGAPPAR